MMQDDDFPLDELPDEIGDLDAHVSHAEPDPNSLGSILTKALRDVDNVGGLDRTRLADLVGRETYNGLLSKPRVADAIDDYLSAPPQLRRTAGKRLAVHIARATEHPEVLDRIERELQDTFVDSYGPPAKATPVKSRLQPRHTESLAVDSKIRAQQRSGQRVADPDLVELAKRDDITAYRQARLNSRGQQRQHRHGT